MFISKRKNNYWYLFFKNSAGNISMVSCKTKKKSDALKFLTTFKESTKDKEVIVNTNYKLSDLYNEIIGYAKTNYSDKTVREYKSILRNFGQFTGDSRLKLINIQQIESYKSHKLSSVTAETVNKHLRTLKAGFNFAVKLNWIEKNPFSNIVKIKIPQKEPQIFTTENLICLFGVIEDSLMKSIVSFSLNTGCRLNEVLNLQWNDIDFLNETISIRNKATFRTKSGKMRLLPMTNESKEILLSLKGEVKEGNVIDLNSLESGYVFKKKNGYKYSGDFVTHKFKKYCRKAGLPEHLHFHGLRHTYITNLANKGVPITAIKELAGHSDIKTSLIYTHLSIEDLRKAVCNVKLSNRI